MSVNSLTATRMLVAGDSWPFHLVANPEARVWSLLRFPSADGPKLCEAPARSIQNSEERRPVANLARTYVWVKASFNLGVPVLG